jgi:two-component system cell cycle response regulator
VAVVAPDARAARGLRAQLAETGRNHFDALGAGEMIRAVSGGAAPDLFILAVPAADSEFGLRMLAELRARPQTRRRPVVAVLDAPDQALAARLLDMGADDAALGPTDPEELAVRLDAQLRQKQRNDRLRDRIQDRLRAAITDPLTGLYNRRHALPFLDRLATTSAQEGRPFAVMVADLDHFKQVNDTHGHAAGDAVLCRVAQLLQANLRGDDLLARIGGEEFLIALPDTPRQRARQTAARLCRIVRQAPIEVAGARIPVTISIGVALDAGRAGNGAPPDVHGLLNRADRALYGAKAGGRNTVTFATRSAA